MEDEPHVGPCRSITVVRNFHEARFVYEVTIEQSDKMEIVKHIGEGGFGHVFRVNRGKGREALKLPHESTTD